MRAIVGAVFSLMTLQMSSTRAIELERTAIFLEFCTGTRIADKIVLTAYHCLESKIPKWASGGGVRAGPRGAGRAHHGPGARTLLTLTRFRKMKA